MASVLEYLRAQTVHTAHMYGFYRSFVLNEIEYFLAFSVATVLLVCCCSGPCAFKTYPLSCRNLPVIRRGPLEGWCSPYGNPYNDRTTTQHVELNGSKS